MQFYRIVYNRGRQPHALAKFGFLPFFSGSPDFDYFMYFFPSVLFQVSCLFSKAEQPLLSYKKKKKKFKPQY